MYLVHMSGVPSMHVYSMAFIGCVSASTYLIRCIMISLAAGAWSKCHFDGNELEAIVAS